MDAVHYKRTTWRQTDVAVPRCHRCRVRHGRSRFARNLVMSAVMAGAFILAWRLCPTRSIGDRGMYLFGGGVVGWIVGIVLGWLAGPVLFARFGKRENHGWTAPAVTEMIAQGWKVGTPRGEAEQLSNPV
jgi:hypothetical protein